MKFISSFFPRTGKNHSGRFDGVESIDVGRQHKVVLISIFREGLNLVNANLYMF